MQHQTERRPATWFDVPRAGEPTREEDPGRMLLSALALSAVVWIGLAVLLGTVLLG